MWKAADGGGWFLSKMIHNYCYVHELRVGGVSVVLTHGWMSLISIYLVYGTTMDGHLLVLHMEYWGCRDTVVNAL